MTPLHYGCRSNRPTCSAVKPLIESGADRYCLFPLHHACLCESVDENVVRILLESGADVDCQTCHRNFPSHFALKKGNLVIIRLLNESGAMIPADHIKKWAFVAGNRPEILENIGFAALDADEVTRRRLLS